MEGRRFKTRSSDDAVVEESMRLARRLSKRPPGPLLHLMAAGLLGFAFALLLTRPAR